MKQFSSLIVLLLAAFFSMAQDSTRAQPGKDTTALTLAARIRSFGVEEAERSIKKYEAGRIKIEQEALIEQIKTTSQQARILMNRGFDTLGLKKKLNRSNKILPIVRDGIFENKGTIQTQRNLSVSSVILNELIIDLKEEKLLLDIYINALSSFRFKIDSLNSKTVLYTFPADSAEIMQYVKKIRVVAKVIGPIDTAITQSLNWIDEFQNELNNTIFILENHREQIENFSKDLTLHSWQSDVPGISGPNGFSRPMMEIIRFSIAKETLALRFYTADNIEKLVLVLLLILAAGIFLRSLKGRVSEEGNTDFSNIDNLVLRFPFASGIIIVLSLFQFLFLEPPFIFSYLLWFTILVCMTVLFRTTISSYWFRFWLIITLMFLLAGVNNMVLQASRTERWFMLFLELAGILYGSWILLYGHRHDLKESKILYFVGFMAVLESFAVYGNFFGRYNLSKTLMVSGFMGIVIAILFLWTVRLINQGLRIVSRVYKHPEKNLFYINFSKIGDKVPGIFYVFLVIGWFILVGKNFYAFQRLSKSINTFMNEERIVGNYTFSVNSLFIFFVILLGSVAISRIISFFADDPDVSFSSESERKKVRLGSWLLLVQIFVISMGLFLAIAASGIPLDKITIVIGALGVGIGLGLQGLVNNLVSGLVIAFEKPVNVGDSIEVNGKSGTMKSIGFRSSMVTLSDGASLIIPNGDLLNHQLINWSQGKGLKRISLSVRVAYGTDLEKASQLVLDELSGDKRIRPSPAPLVVPKEFGQNAIELEILYWIHQSANNFLIKGALITNIDKSFAAEGIEIPLPKMNFHIEKETNHNDGAKENP